jgi:hypothetical protein
VTSTWQIHPPAWRDPDIEAVLSIGRRPSGVSHPKLQDRVRADLFDFSTRPGELSGYDACFFCLGVSSVRMTEAEYTHLTYDLTTTPSAMYCWLWPPQSGPFSNGFGPLG